MKNLSVLSIILLLFTGCITNDLVKDALNDPLPPDTMLISEAGSRTVGFKPLYLPVKVYYTGVDEISPNPMSNRPDRMLTSLADRHKLITELMLITQKFYADEMERHGYGRKSFKLETDDNNNLIIHRLPFVNDQVINYSYHDIHMQEQTDKRELWVIFVDAPVEVHGCGFGSGFEWTGHAVMVQTGCWTWQVVSHEVGHALGLNHTSGNVRYMMNPIGVNNPFMSKESARILDRHPTMIEDFK